MEAMSKSVIAATENISADSRVSPQRGTFRAGQNREKGVTTMDLGVSKLLIGIEGGRSVLYQQKVVSRT